MAVKDLTQATFADEVTGADQLVVVDYWADWCQPCKKMAPIIEELATAYEGRVKFVKVDTNAEPALAAQQGVMSLPTLEFWHNGQVVQTLNGGKSKLALTKAIDELL